jgi:hypothetical protein
MVTTGSLNAWTETRSRRGATKVIGNRLRTMVAPASWLARPTERGMRASRPAPRCHGAARQRRRGKHGADTEQGSRCGGEAPPSGEHRTDNQRRKDNTGQAQRRLKHRHYADTAVDPHHRDQWHHCSQDHPQHHRARPSPEIRHLRILSTEVPPDDSQVSTPWPAPAQPGWSL